MEEYIEKLKAKCPVAINNFYNYFFEMVYCHYMKSKFAEDISDMNTFYVMNDYNKFISNYKYYKIYGQKDYLTNLNGTYKIKDFDKAEKYYITALLNKNPIAITNLAHYFYDVKNYKEMEKYYLMAIESGYFMAMYSLGNYFYNMENNFEEMKKYYMMAVKYNCPFSMSKLIKYYNFKRDDFSFLDINPKNLNIGNDIEYCKFLNDKFKGNFTLPLEYHSKFCAIVTKVDSLSTCIRNKQYILKKTGVYPKYYDKEYMIHFMELCISGTKNKLPKDLILLIAGHLFV